MELSTSVRNDLRKKHLVELAAKRANSDDEEEIRRALSERLVALERLDRRLSEANKNELRHWFQQFLKMIRDCVTVYGREASATLSLEVGRDGKLKRIDVGIGTDEDPSYVGDYDVVVVVGQNPYVSYARIEAEIREEIGRQKEALDELLREFDS